MKLSDVTLREGDQMPGRNYTTDQKIDSAHQLDKLGIDFVQAGFPATGEKDQTVITELAEAIQADVVALARALIADIDAALDANTDVVDVFIPVSDLHLEHLLGMSRDDMIKMLGDAVDYVYDHSVEIHVTLADAFRTDTENLIEVIETVPQAQYVTLADTVGARTPKSVEKILLDLKGNIDLSRIGVHFHDDLGCATANTLVAYNIGVAKADISIAALGERAGNTSLEEVVAACSTDRGNTLGIEESKLIPVCKQVLNTLGEEVDERKPILGNKIAEHESGIHTAAMLENPATLEPYDPQRFGGSRQLLFGASTGSSASRQILERAGVDFDDNTVKNYKEVLTEQGPLTFDESITLAKEMFGD
ncbi:LeuA family protein [Halorarum salinum]|uniref:2-isopropylmalate synthase n=1 Tax=Halorarum salinum TaxID=2743089 RepID=A0A7D5QGA5_9EURY|nr:citramalate synthase [Halobaculum salinum]QLG61922.1 citramalate synthase [Halobaculum salinum]